MTLKNMGVGFRVGTRKYVLGLAKRNRQIDPKGPCHMYTSVRTLDPKANLLHILEAPQIGDPTYQLPSAMPRCVPGSRNPKYS